MSAPTSNVCSTSRLFGDDYRILSKASSIRSTNFRTLGIFVVLFIFFAWVILSNLNTIYIVYMQYKENVRYKLKEVDGYLYDPANPAYDDEVYNRSRDKTDPLYNDNAYIQKNITRLRQQYQKYNEMLRKNNLSEDVIDQHMVDPLADNYMRK